MNLEKYTGKKVKLASGDTAWIEGPAHRLIKEGAIGGPKDGELMKMLDTMVYGKINGLGKLIDYRDITAILS